MMLGVAGVSPAREGGEQQSASQGETSPLLRTNSLEVY